MRRLPVFDPRYVRTGMQTASSLANIARCAVYRANGERPDWVPGVGVTDNGLDLIWEGPCRIQPVIDMRARMRDFQGEYDAAQSVRFNLPFEVNEHGAVLNTDGSILSYGDDPEFGFGDVVDVTAVYNPGQQALLPKRFTVRNALVSTTAFEHDLLCDVGTSLHG